jgi:hypothetical protein
MFFIEKTPFFLIKSDDKPRNYTWFHGQYKEVCPVKDLPWLTFLFDISVNMYKIGTTLKTRTNNMKIKKILFLVALLSTVSYSSPISWLFSHTNKETLGSPSWFQRQTEIIHNVAPSIDPRVLHLSLLAYTKARMKGFDQKELLTVIDYSKPSTEKRLWVFDLKHGRTLFHTWVSHGKNTGDTIAKSFSNKPGSLKSSIGVFVTEYVPYMGGNGYSLRMRGMEPGINDKAYERDIVFHGAWYVNSDTIKRYGKVGRSWGCPAVDDKTAQALIDTIKENTVVFAYYPDRNWLAHSQYLT